MKKKKKFHMSTHVECPIDCNAKTQCPIMHAMHARPIGAVDQALCILVLGPSYSRSIL